jgi:hypothetical protein
LKLDYDEPLSSFAFRFNLRRYTVGITPCVDGFWALVFLPPVIGVVVSYAAGTHLHR